MTTNGGMGSPKHLQNFQPKIAPGFKKKHAGTKMEERWKDGRPMNVSTWDIWNRWAPNPDTISDATLYLQTEVQHD